MDRERVGCGKRGSTLGLGDDGKEVRQGLRMRWEGFVCYATIACFSVYCIRGSWSRDQLLGFGGIFQ